MAVRSIQFRVFSLLGVVFIGLIVLLGFQYLTSRAQVAELRKLASVNLNSLGLAQRLVSKVNSQNIILSRAPSTVDLKAQAADQKSFAVLSTEIDVLLTELDTVCADTARIKAELIELRKNFAVLRQEATEVYKLSSQFQQTEAAEVLQTRALPLQIKAAVRLDAVQSSAIELANAQPSLLIARAEQVNRYTQLTGWCVILATALGCFFFTRRTITRPLLDLAADLTVEAARTSEAAAQFSATSQQLAEGASQSAASLETSSASLEQISGLTSDIAARAELAREQASRTRAAADSGTAGMQELNLAMEQIKTATADVTAIIKTIREIAFQTNILSLNAAVEAARAGEAGAGFAVVADEVRALATRSASAAKDSAEKIDRVLACGLSGTAVTAKVGGLLTEIAQCVHQMDEVVTYIATSMQEQKIGIQQVSNGLHELDTHTQRNAALAEESAGSGAELTSQTTHIRAIATTVSQLALGEASEPVVKSDGLTLKAALISRSNKS